MLESIPQVLKPNGLVLFFVPNGHSLIVRLSREHNSTVSGRAHLWYFTPETMNKILVKNGFSKVSEFSVLPQLHEIEHFLQYNNYMKKRFHSMMRNSQFPRMSASVRELYQQK